MLQEIGTVLGGEAVDVRMRRRAGGGHGRDSESVGEEERGALSCRWAREAAESGGGEEGGERRRAEQCVVVACV